MDPSCTIGFLCSSLAEFHELRKQAEKLLAPPLQKGVYPFFSFSDLSLEQMLDTSVNMRLGSLVDDSLLLEDPISGPRRSGHSGRRKGKRKDILEGVVFCDDEDFVVVECTRTVSTSQVEDNASSTGSGESEGIFAEAEIVGLGPPLREVPIAPQSEEVLAEGRPIAPQNEGVSAEGVALLGASNIRVTDEAPASDDSKFPIN